MTWTESDQLTWDEREVLLAMADKRHERSTAAAPALTAAERLARRTT